MLPSKPDENAKDKDERAGPTALRIVKRIAVVVLALVLAAVLMWLMILALGRLVLRELF